MIPALKKALALLCCSVSLTANAADAPAKPTWGEHGMAMFGGSEGLYASHLPMLHAPHDYQVLLRFHLADARQDAALRHRLNGKTALWTIAPEAFELDRLAPGSSHPLNQFKADLVRGHFEKNGKTEYRGASVVVDSVLLFRQLSVAPAKNATARYVQIGSGKQRFLVKEIDSRPDFEHIVAFDSRADAPRETVSVDKQGLLQPSDAALTTALGTPAHVRGTVYFSTEDLR